MSAHTQIVVTFTTMTGLKPTGRMVMRDMNWFPEFVACEEPKAAMWLRCGTEGDVAKAKTHMAREHEGGRWAVYTFPKEHRDPLGAARAQIMTDPKFVKETK